jgi:LysW-gamma-L-alpha-aminoadipyl-6-phosphate/LysW-L-glutamyl-5-phosphate reductase
MDKGGSMIKAAIIGGSGYTGGELLRLLIAHPEVEVVQVSSRSHLGEYVYQVHPNLRKQTMLKFSDPETILPVDILFLALPHGTAQYKINQFAAIAPTIIDLSADFRLHNPENYQHWYGAAHASPEWLDKFVYGLPEIHREQLRGAHYASGVGCNATACNLALLPLVKAGLIEMEKQVIVELKVGSSEGGAEGNAGTHHPERSGVIRTFSAFGHRHTAEVIQELGLSNVTAAFWQPPMPPSNQTFRPKTYGRLTGRWLLKIHLSASLRNSAASTGFRSQKSWLDRTMPIWVLTWMRPAGMWSPFVPSTT